MAEFKPIVSSNLDAAAYDPKAKVLVIRFKNGTSYRYPKFPQDLWKKFEKTFDGKDGRSAGKFFFAEIRQLPSEKIEVDDEV
jgi:hypothetical protein